VDRITKSLLDEFIADNSLDTLTEEVAFEHFCGYLVTSNYYGESFQTEDIHVGSGGDAGIDCIAIIVNGCLISDPEEIEDLATNSSYLDATLSLYKLSVLLLLNLQKSASSDLEYKISLPSILLLYKMTVLS